MNPFTCRENIPTRLGFSQGVLEAAIKNKQIVGFGSDITGSVGMDLFAKRFPDRFFSLGIAEQNAATIAAGMTLAGKIPFIASYATFITLRAADQIRVSICYNNFPVKIGGAHSGISVGPDGATHQALEDIAIMRCLPNMTVLSPCDSTQTKAAVLASIKINGPVYIRYGREAMPDFTTPEMDFMVGKAQILRKGKHCAIVATGAMVWEALKAADLLDKEKINCSVINLHTIKPIDENTLVKMAKNCGAVVTAEEHQLQGGMGSAVCEVLAQYFPVPVEMVGMPNCFGESGKPNELMKKYGMTDQHIVSAVKKVLKRKNKAF